MPANFEVFASGESAGSPVTIRTATATDQSCLGRLGAQLVRLHHEFDPQRFIAATAHTEPGYAAFLGRQADAADAIVLVAEVHGKVVGYVYCGLEGHDYMALRGPAGVIYDLVVDPECRGRGIGRKLLEEATSILKDRGAPRVVLSTATENEAARRMFEKLGFRPTMIELTKELD